MCGRKKPKDMIDKKQRGSNDLEVIIYELKKQIDLLKEEIQVKEIQIQKLKESKPLQYDELGL
jgi:uncharacterized small protein (DUF1192 family)